MGVMKATTQLYRGITQAQMVEALFMGLLTGEPVLFVGEHASLKSSLSDFTARIFEKPVVHIKESFDNPPELELWILDISKKLELDEELLTKNLIDGINVEYAEYSGKVHCSIAIDAAKYRRAEAIRESVHEPIWYFSRQLTDQDQPEDILGFVVEHPALLGHMPPHLVKKGRLTGSDFGFLDEIFSSPLLLAHLHRALNEKVYDTTIGQATIRPIGIVAATNFWNDYYPTNPKLASMASIAPDEPIVLKDGKGEISVETIGEFVDRFFTGSEEGQVRVNDYEVLAMGTSGEAPAPKFSKFSAVARHRADRLLTLTHDGGSIRLTPNHSVFVFTPVGIECKPADELKQGDYLITMNGAQFERRTPHELPIYNGRLHHKAQAIPRTATLTEDLAWLLGMYVADGSVSTEGAVRIHLNKSTEKDRRSARRVTEIMNSMFALKTWSPKKEAGQLMSVCVGSAPLARWFESHCRHRDGGKKVPGFIFGAEPNIVVAFFKGLIDGDGWTAYGANNRHYLVYDTTNARLSAEVAVLLKLNGVAYSTLRSAVKERKIGSKVLRPTTAYRMYVSESELAGDHYKSNRPQGGRGLPSFLLGGNRYMTGYRRTMSHGLLLRLAPSLRWVLNLAENGVGSYKIREVSSESYGGFVYDICGAEFESFFAGKSLVLCHNSLDRYAFTARGIAPSTQEVLSMAMTKRAEIKSRVPISLIYEARDLLPQVSIPEELLGFAVAIVAHLSRCYFSTSKAQRRLEAISPFEVQRDCSLCLYNGSPCSYANITRTRAMLNIVRGLRALTLLNGRDVATEEDLAEVLQLVLPYRSYWNNQEFVVSKGGPHLAARELIRMFAKDVESKGSAFKEVEKLLSNPDPTLALQLRNKYIDDVIVRSFIDEAIDMMRESARKRGDTKTTNALTEPLQLSKAIAVFS